MAHRLPECDRLIAMALEEDIGDGDVTGALLIPPSRQARLAMVTRQELVVGGLELASKVFQAHDPSLVCRHLAEEGGHVDAGVALLEVEGNARSIMAAERTALNFVMRLSAVATHTARFVRAVEGTGAVILDTRKTMPGYRLLDKYAVRLGGGQNHRMRLDDAILIKDNHIALCGSVGQALERARQGAPAGMRIEVECDTLVQVQEALAAGAVALLLDNMTLEMLREAVALAAGKAVLEASGGVRLETVRAIAETGVQHISVGALTHSPPHVDMGLDIAMQPA